MAFRGFAFVVRGFWGLDLRVGCSAFSFFRGSWFGVRRFEVMGFGFAISRCLFGISHLGFVVFRVSRLLFGVFEVSCYGWGFRVRGFITRGFDVQGFASRGFGFRVRGFQGSRFRVRGSGFGFQGFRSLAFLEFHVRGAGF